MFFLFFRTWREETRGYVSSRPEASDQSGNFDLQLTGHHREDEVQVPGGRQCPSGTVRCGSGGVPLVGNSSGRKQERR